MGGLRFDRFHQALGWFGSLHLTFWSRFPLILDVCRFQMVNPPDMGNLASMEQVNGTDLRTKQVRTPLVSPFSQSFSDILQPQMLKPMEKTFPVFAASIH